MWFVISPMLGLRPGHDSVALGYGLLMLAAPEDTIGISFDEIWLAAVGFLTTDPILGIVQTVGGALVAFLIASMIIRLVWGR